MKRAAYGLPAKCVEYMGLVWAEGRNNTHTLPMTRQLWVVFLQSCSTISVLSVVFVWSVDVNKSKNRNFELYLSLPTNTLD